MLKGSVPRVVAGLAATVALAAAASPAAASSAGWVFYAAAPAASTVQIVLGASDGLGGCTFDLSAALPPGQAAVAVDEVAYNATTCQSSIATTQGSAVPTDPAEPSGSASSASSASGPVVTPLSTGSTPQPPGVVPAASIRSAGYFKSWFQDPVFKVVNSVQDSTTWNWNRTCATGISGSYQYMWFTPTSWLLADNNWQNYYTCPETTVSSYVHFTNPIFCDRTFTDVYYDRNTVHGRHDGWLLGSVHTHKSGACSYLLSVHYVLRRTLN
jgi:hypothetical protein